MLIARLVNMDGSNPSNQATACWKGMRPPLWKRRFIDAIPLHQVTACWKADGPQRHKPDNPDEFP